MKECIAFLLMKTLDGVMCSPIFTPFVIKKTRFERNLQLDLN